jgi:hypothetical protein
MISPRAIGGSILGAALALSLSGCWGIAPLAIPQPAWVTERMNEKYDKRLWNRAAVLPPILPGQPIPTCEDPPSEEEIVRLLPRVRRGIPFIIEEFRDDFDFDIQKVVDSIDPCTYFPLVGPAQLHHCHFVVTVRWKERLKSDQPFPFWVENERTEVLQMDKDHLHLCVGNDPRYQQSMFNWTSGNYR